MDLGSSGGHSSFVYFGDSGGGSGGDLFGVFVLLVLLVALSVGLYQCQHSSNLRFCTDVCSQYESAPELRGTNCYCRDSQGIYDPTYGHRPRE